MPVRPVAGATLALASVLLATAGLAACSGGTAAGGHPGTGPVEAVAAESTYASVVSQVGGAYVRVTSVQSNPNTDPHTFEASASVSQEVSAAELIVQNGLGYDSYMDAIESASPDPARRVITAAHLLGLPDSTPNPHLWYSPETMPAVAKAVADDLSQLRPAHAAYFRARLAAFDDSLHPWLAAIAAFRADYPAATVAATEPVADYLLSALGTRVLTPFGLQADIMNGVDLPPQYVTLQDSLLRDRKVAVFVYNEQVADSVTEGFRAEALRAGIPVVGVYETMPAGYTYQSWMLAEVRALAAAVAGGAP